MRQALVNETIINLNTMTRYEILNLNKRRSFKCIRCKKPVILKVGTKKRAHFAHAKGRYHEGIGESSAHKLVKEIFSRWLTSQGAQVTIEKRFPQIDRIADVYFVWQGQVCVLEIQKSQMSDEEFSQRMQDYEKINIKVIWIFLGDLKIRGARFRLPSVMTGRPLNQYFHFCTRTARLSIFKSPVFVSTKDIYVDRVDTKLKNVLIDVLMGDGKEGVKFEADWLDVKQDFRMSGWYYAAKSERKLSGTWGRLGGGLAFLPPEVGWPVAGNQLGKGLFVWQAYVVAVIMDQFEVGDWMNVSELVFAIKREFGLGIRKEGLKQLKGYLGWLVKFGILGNKKGYYEVLRLPLVYNRLEICLEKDAQLLARFL